MSSSEEERSRKHVLRHECKIRVEMLIRCLSKNTGEISDNWVPIKAGLLDLHKNAAHLHAKEPFQENQELRLAIGFPTGVIVKVSGLAYVSKFIPKREFYGVEVRFMAMSDTDRTRLEYFLNSLG